MPATNTKTRHVHEEARALEEKLAGVLGSREKVDCRALLAESRAMIARLLGELPAPATQPMEAGLHTIEEWGRLTGIVVIEPDGFDRSDPKLMTRKFTHAEFIHGTMWSTCRSVPPQVR